MPILIATEVTLAKLHDRFGIVRSSDVHFFSRGFTPQSDITEAEQAILDRVQQNYLSQLEAQFLSEETVKMVVVSPLLDIAGFYRYPFTIDSEVSIEIQESNRDDILLTGRIDTLIVREHLWILVVESKRSRFSVQAAIPQALSYLLAKPQIHQPGYALITNGGEFLFVKLENSTYSFSETFSLLNAGNDLYEVLRILKQISNLLWLMPSTQN